MARDPQARVRAAPDQVVAFVAEAHGPLFCAPWPVFKPGAELAGALGRSAVRPWRGRGAYRALLAWGAQRA